MDISNIPNEFHKEIIDKDGQKIIFDFKNLDKSKKEYIRLTQDEYGKLKERAMKRKKINTVYGILGWILFILGIIIAFYTHSWWSLLVLSISLAFIIRSNMDCSTPSSFNLYGNAYVDVKYADVGMNRLDIISILALEEEFWTIVNYSATSNRASCFKPLLPVSIYTMLTGLTQCPQALGFGSSCRTIVYV